MAAGDASAPSMARQPTKPSGRTRAPGPVADVRQDGRDTVSVRQTHEAATADEDRTSCSGPGAADMSNAPFSGHAREAICPFLFGALM
jgi:hypothetical protein